LDLIKYLSEWSSSSSKVIDWFVNDFCKGELPSHAPMFVVFIQLIYPESDSFFSKIKTKLAKQKRKKELKHLGLDNWFNDLQKVDKEDINTWLDNVSLDKWVKDDWFKRYFKPNNTYYHMSYVEGRLSEIIEAFNTNTKEEKYNSQ
jgi:hypothetical protein